MKPQPRPSRPPLRLHLLALTSVLACTLASPALAQSTASAPLPSMVVSGSMQEQAVDDLPQSIDVITAEQLEEQQSQSLRDALQDLPNTSVRTAPARLAVGASSSAFARDGNTGINIRGIGGNRVLMTVDGIRMPRSYVSRSAIFDREYLSLELFKRIELLRGPASALYGSDGLAGVVNFVTLDPQDFLGEDRTLGGRVAAQYGSEDDGKLLAGTLAGKASESVQWMLSAQVRRAHAQKTMGDNDAPDSRRTSANPQNDGDQALLAKVVISPGGGQRHVLGFEHVGRDSDVALLSSRTPVPSKPGDVLSESSRYDATRDRLTWDARYDIASGWADQLRTIVAAQQGKSRRVGTSDLHSGVHRVRDNRYQERLWQLGLQAEKVLRAGDWSHRLAYGAEYTRNDISNLYDGLAPLPPDVFPLKRFPDTRESTSALYLQDETVWGDWTFTPGLRIDHFAIDVTSQSGFYPPAAQPGKSLSKAAVLPKLGVLWRASSEWSLFGQYSQGLRAPEPGQLNDHFEVVVPGSRVVIQPNPNLQPERSRGLEIGARARYERLKLDATAFVNDYSNLIVDAEFIKEVGNTRYFQSVNVGRARIHGFELKGSYDWGVLGQGRLSSSFSWGMARGKNRETGRPLNSVDPAQATLGVRYDTAPWSLWANLRYRQAKKPGDIDNSAIFNSKPDLQFATPSFTTLDVGGQWRLAKDTRLNLAIHNLTNRKYWLWSDVYGQSASSAVLDAYTQPGRSLRVSLVKDF
ncbi:TonB-dependent hemoglobin/transferrin/lactoferrin family receptor [Comamonas sp. NLF-1-9]|uniref:TonB-dependent hemoglobin/transferrin/lactoferrin family receptor n=1 Tax=Comamonas sp. NLF-1-9 TaxID=2853163 RepID=UPI001C47B64D|nr:TonB-dependent hemoglobin/transferrin/lactoferrin family receptor [Comamonas sp. NLF-1-9]QXL84626.1 TonB-dependent hemoglobin/transferrin/lactoferrin family receptor [Comamonas sp. NLF-1-9]